MEQVNAISASSFYGKRFATLASAEDAIANTKFPNSEIDVVIIPPEPDYQTDEEEFDEDDLVTASLPQDVPGEIEIAMEDDSDEEYNMPLSQVCTTLSKKPKISQPKWSSEPVDLKMTSANGYSIRLEKVREQLSSCNVIQIFEKLFDEQVVNLLVEQTNKYATASNNHSFQVTGEEIKIFVGVLLFSGYHKLPRARLYWCLDEDVNVPFVSNCISRNRFEEIKKYIHLADNTQIDRSDKMYKVRPLMNLLNNKFQQFGIFHECLSIDEAMVRYFGHHSAKQFIKGKPVRFGYKDWMLCSSSGYCYAFDTYCGAKPTNSEVEIPRSTLPLGSQVVIDLLKVLKEPTDHIVFFDNYFTSYDLLTTLRGNGVRATGTVRENRTKKCPILPSAQMKKKDRGNFDYRYDKENSLLFVRWHDNSVVTMATNYDGIEPMSQVKRWSSKKKEKISVPQPKLFQTYNAFMGGVDLLDQSVNGYRVAIHGKKWWWVLFTHMINVTVVNAWRLYQLAFPQDPMDLLLFQRNVTRHYLRSYNKSIQRRSTSSRPSGSLPRSLLDDPTGHFPKKLSNQLRCSVCHSRIRWACEKCNVTLCIERDCFKIFHTRK
ncbi:piggyBac transposable element-derived protein 2-like [Photinus pyralis]|nr:piggyBac transposable element-derived protein 2-like [Photinus pyralis]